MTVELREKDREETQRPELGHGREKKRVDTVKKTLFLNWGKIYTFEI